MKPIYFTFLALTLSISLYSQGQTVPKTWSSAMKLQAHYGGGMMYYKYDILITDTSSYMKIESNEGAKNYTRKFTAKELDALLAFLDAHRFDKIKSEDTGPTHDKASESISLSWDSNWISVSENSSMRVSEKYRDDFNAIQAYVEELFRKDK